MARNRVSDNLRHDMIVLSHKFQNFLRACRSVVDLAAAFEPPLKSERIFAEIVQKARQGRGVRGAKFAALCSRQGCYLTQMLMERLPAEIFPGR